MKAPAREKAPFARKGRQGGGSRRQPFVPAHTLLFRSKRRTLVDLLFMTGGQKKKL